MQQAETNISTIEFTDNQKKSVKIESSQKPIVGKDILEILTTGMYLDPLVIYREYIQNSVDAIDEALSENILDFCNDFGATNHRCSFRNHFLRVMPTASAISGEKISQQRARKLIFSVAPFIFLFRHMFFRLLFKRVPTST